MKIYTRTGDAGETALLAGPRVTKSHPRLVVCGELDELNCLLGLARCEALGSEVDAVLARLQEELFSLGAEVAAPNPGNRDLPHLDLSHVGQLELDIDRFDQSLPALSNFVLPGGCRAGALLHLARAVCRRVERQVVPLHTQSADSLGDHVVPYLNRLSDLLFVLGRAANAAAQIEDVIWNPSH